MTEDDKTDRQTDARGKTICLPTLAGGGGDIIKIHRVIYAINTTRKIIDSEKLPRNRKTSIFD